MINRKIQEGDLFKKRSNQDLWLDVEVEDQGEVSLMVLSSSWRIR